MYNLQFLKLKGQIMNTILKIATLAAVLVLVACGSEPEVSVAESCTGNHRPTWCNNIRSETPATESEVAEAETTETEAVATEPATETEV